MPNLALQALAKLAHEPVGNFTLETEFGLRIDVVEGRFKVRMSGLEKEEEPETGHESAEPSLRRRTYDMDPYIEDDHPIWLVETSDSTLSRPEKPDMETRYPKNSKEWTEAWLEWEQTGRAYTLRNSPFPRKGPNKPKPASSAKWNSWVFQGGMLACWLALQHDVLSVKHCFWVHKEGCFTHENAGDELQRFLKGYPWAKKEAKAGQS